VAAVDAAVRDLGIAGGLDGMERFEGRRIVELRPEGAGGKGAAVARLIDRARPGAVVVRGDDRSDAEAFVVVRAVRKAGTVADALAIGIRGAAETPPEIPEAADVVVAGPHVAARRLGALASALERED